MSRIQFSCAAAFEGHEALHTQLTFPSTSGGMKTASGVL